MNAYFNGTNVELEGYKFIGSVSVFEPGDVYFDSSKTPNYDIEKQNWFHTCTEVRPGSILDGANPHESIKVFRRILVAAAPHVSAQPSLQQADASSLTHQNILVIENGVMDDGSITFAKVIQIPGYVRRITGSEIVKKDDIVIGKSFNGRFSQAFAHTVHESNVKNREYLTCADGFGGYGNGEWTADQLLKKTEGVAIFRYDASGVSDLFPSNLFNSSYIQYAYEGPYSGSPPKSTKPKKPRARRQVDALPLP